MKKYCCVKQHDITDCAAACLATVCKHYGYITGIEKIRRLAGTDKEGTSAYGVVLAARQLGLDAKAVSGSKEALMSGISVPCIAHVIYKGCLLHYVVIHEVTSQQIIIADPAKGIVKLKPEEFFTKGKDERHPPEYFWTGVLIFLTPNESFIKGNDKKGLKDLFSARSGRRRRHWRRYSLNPC